MSTDTTKPADWKTYDQFALGIATNRLPPTDALTGQTLVLALPDFRLTLKPRTQHTLDWQEEGARGGQAQGDWYEAIEVAPDTFFLDITQASRPTEALTVVLNTRTQVFHHELVVHHFMPYIDRRAEDFQSTVDDFDGAIDTSAEAAGIGEFDLHD